MIKVSYGNGLELDIPRTFGRYSYFKTLGCGASSAVVEAIHTTTGFHYAVKIVSRTHLNETGEFQSFEQELRIHKTLNHPNVVKIHDVIYQPLLIFVVLDLCGGGDLLSYVINHPQSHPAVHKRILFQVLSALAYIHGRGIAHRDIKPDNILLTDDLQVKLADFGCCEDSRLGRDPRGCGTMYYAAPEGITKPQKAGAKSDIWSFGILLFTLFAGHLPWIDGDDQFVSNQIVTRQFTTSFMLPHDVIAVFDRCTQMDPENRPTAAELLRSPWFASEATRVRCFKTIQRPRRISASTSVQREGTVFETSSMFTVRPKMRGFQSFPAISMGKIV